MSGSGISGVSGVSGGLGIDFAIHLIAGYAERIYARPRNWYLQLAVEF